MKDKLLKLSCQEKDELSVGGFYNLKVTVFEIPIKNETR
jgi:hypothetical protein